MQKNNRSSADNIRVVVVDDSPTARELLVTLFRDMGGMEVVGAGATGEDAVQLVKRLRPDVVTIDVRMPKMDGLEATRRIMREFPTPIVIVTASVMRSDMDLTFEALRAGALTVVSKPGMADPETCDRVIQAVRLMSDVPVVHRWDGGEKAQDVPVSPDWDAWHLPEDIRRRIQRIGMASSTGGPEALAKILGPLPASFPVPILVVQHITRGFAVGLAEWLDSMTTLRVSLAGHGEIPRPGTVLLAPDDYHMRVSRGGVIELCKEPPYKGVRPSANYLFHSLTEAYGSRSMGIILTGMGDDGVEGLTDLHQAGGLVLAQEEQSCVVYGMSGEAVTRNIVDRVLTLDQIARVLSQLVRRQGDEVVAYE